MPLLTAYYELSTTDHHHVVHMQEWRAIQATERQELMRYKHDDDNRDEHDDEVVSAANNNNNDEDGISGGGTKNDHGE